MALMRTIAILAYTAYCLQRRNFVLGETIGKLNNLGILISGNVVAQNTGRRVMGEISV